MFKEILKVLHNATLPDIISILKKNMIFNGSSLSSIDVLRTMLNGTHPTLNVDLDLEEKWKIVFKINGSPKFTSKQKQIYTDYM